LGVGLLSMWVYLLASAQLGVPETGYVWRVLRRDSQS
jgi:hypothetical protein